MSKEAWTTDNDIEHMVLVGYANGDLHEMVVPPHQKVNELALAESQSIGQLSNAGFRIVVAAAWRIKAKRTAGLYYSAGWNDSEVEVYLHTGDRIAGSHSLYSRWTQAEGDRLSSGELLQYSRRLKIE